MYADITIKARCADPDEMENILLKSQAEYQGIDMQTDTYYEADIGKLKHREGNIEHVLIHYKRLKSGDASKTEVLLYLKNPSATTVEAVCGERKVIGQVKKNRKIFFIDNVKFHIDQVEGIGQFIEIEAIDLDGSVGEEVLRQQCNYYKNLLQVDDEDLVHEAYMNQ